VRSPSVDNSPERGLSNLLTAILIPVCVWGMLATLLLHLLDVRAVFIHDDAWRMRQAVLAFAAGVILIQMLSREQGPRTAGAYGWLLGLSMTAFAVYQAFAYRIAIPWPLVALVNLTLFGLLWWVGQRVMTACTVHDQAAAHAAETGVFSRAGSAGPEAEVPPDAAPDALPPGEDLGVSELYAGVRRERERKRLERNAAEDEAALRERMNVPHPGRVIFRFSLFAIPAFGAGFLLLGGQHEIFPRLRVGILLFLYLYCSLLLLCLAGLSQMRAYFNARGVRMPDPLALTWIGLGLSLVTLALALAFFLPQPVTAPQRFVRDQMVGVYRGLEGKRGAPSQLAGSTPGDQAPPRARKFHRDELNQMLKERYEPIDKLGDEYISELARTTGAEPEYQNAMKLRAAMQETYHQVGQFAMKAIFALAILGGVVVLVVLAWVFLGRLSEGLRRLRLARRPRRPRRPRRKAGTPVPLERFGRFANPFTRGYDPGDGNALVRYLWQATLAYCADAGAPCPPDLTPLEFVEQNPAPLAGFERNAMFIADLVSYSEFSGQPIPAETLPRLREYWSALARHAHARGA